MSGVLHSYSEYYLHENGKVIYKPRGDVDSSSPFVRAVWRAVEVGRTPETYLDWLKELQRLGAAESELQRLVEIQHLRYFIPDALEQLGLETPGQ